MKNTHTVDLPKNFIKEGRRKSSVALCHETTTLHITVSSDTFALRTEEGKNQEIPVITLEFCRKATIHFAYNCEDAEEIKKAVTIPNSETREIALFQFLLKHFKIATFWFLTTHVAERNKARGRNEIRAELKELLQIEELPYSHD